MSARPPLWVKCPVCHHLSAMLDISLSRQQPHYECEECGHAWEMPRPEPPVRPKKK